MPVQQKMKFQFLVRNSTAHYNKMFRMHYEASCALDSGGRFNHLVVPVFLLRLGQRFQSQVYWGDQLRYTKQKFTAVC